MDSDGQMKPSWVNKEKRCNLSGSTWGNSGFLCWGDGAAAVSKSWIGSVGEERNGQSVQTKILQTFSSSKSDDLREQKARRRSTRQKQ